MTLEDVENFDKRRGLPSALLRSRAKSLVANIFGRQVPLHRQEDYSPFFIVGSGRCGTTLLRRILEANPAVHVPPESYVFAEVTKVYACQCRLLSWHHLVDLILAIFEYQKSFEVWFKESLRPLALRLHEVPWSKRSLAYIIDQLYRYHSESIGKVITHWGDKTPLNTFFLDEITAVFPKAKIIHLLRDGLDVVSSMVRANLAPDLCSAAARWKSSVRRARDFGVRFPERYLEVRYEELVSRAAETVPRICDFLQIEYSPVMVNSIDHVNKMLDVIAYPHLSKARGSISTNSLGKGRQDLNQAQQDEVLKFIGRELKELGYLAYDRSA